VERFVVPLVLIAVTIATDAVFAKGGPLHLFTSRAGPPTIAQPVSPSDLLGGCGRARYRGLRKGVEAQPMLVGKAPSVGGTIGHVLMTTRRTANQADRTGLTAVMHWYITLSSMLAMRLRSRLSLSKGLPNGADHIGRKVRMSRVKFQVRKTRA